MKTLKEIKAEIAIEIGEPNGVDFMIEIEAELGQIKTAKALFRMVEERYLNQFQDEEQD